MNFGIKSTLRIGFGLLMLALSGACATSGGMATGKTVSAATAEEAEKFVADADRIDHGLGFQSSPHGLIQLFPSIFFNTFR